MRVAGAGVADYAGNSGIGEGIERWVYGNAPPYIEALVGITQPARNTPLTAIDLVFSEPIDLATLDAADLTLTRDGGSDLLTGEPSLSEVVPGTYRLSGLTELTADPGFYVLSLDATGIQDLEGSAGIGSESVNWTMDVSPPTILELQQVATSPRNTVVSSLAITFSEPIDPASFGPEDLTLRRNGTGPDLIDYRVTIEEVDVAKYRIAGFHWVVGYEGIYDLTVDALGVVDVAGNAGTGQATASWVMDTTPPAAPTNLRIDPDRGISDSDSRTNTATVTFSGEVAEQPLTVRLFNVTTETDLGRVEASEFMFSKTIILGTPGHHRLRAQAIDQAGNFSAASFFDVFIDLAPPTVATVLGGPAAIQTEPLSSLILVFTENVFGSDFDRGRLILTRDAGPNLIGETVTVSRLADDRFEITGLSDLTDQQGDYRLHLDLTGLSDAAGNTGTSFELRWQLQAALGEIGDWVWFDLNGDGIQDLEEVGFGGITVRLYLGDGTYLQETVTDADGYYRFRNLSTAEFYFLEFVAPAGYAFSPANQGADSGFDSDADIQTGRTVTFTITPGENLHWDTGLLRFGRISGLVWLDSDASGQRDGDERVLAGQAVYLDLDQDDQKGADEPTATTDENGQYAFENLRPGQYVVRLVVQEGWEQTHPSTGGAASLTFTGSDAMLFTPGIRSFPGVAPSHLAGRADANGDGYVSALDVLLIVNALNAREISESMRSQQVGDPRDVNGDGLITPLDALIVINVVHRADGNPVPVPLAAGGTAGEVQLAHRLIGLDMLRTDPRFTDLDGRGLSVVVIDTGLDLDHPFFGSDADGDGVADRIVFHYDFADRNADARDFSGHGSHVTSIIASQDSTYPGVAPGVDIIHLQVFSDRGHGNFSYLEQALQWVIRHFDTYQIAAVNLSLGDGQNWSQPVGLYGMADELAAMDALGVITVSAAGNSYAVFGGVEGLAYPAADPHSLSIGAVWSFDPSTSGGGISSSPGGGPGSGEIGLLDGSFAYAIQLEPGQHRDDIHFGTRPADIGGTRIDMTIVQEHSATGENGEVASLPRVRVGSTSGSRSGSRSGSAHRTRRRWASPRRRWICIMTPAI